MVNARAPPHVAPPPSAAHGRCRAPPHVAPPPSAAHGRCPRASPCSAAALGGVLLLVGLHTPDPPFGHLLPASGEKGNLWCCYPSPRVSGERVAGGRVRGFLRYPARDANPAHHSPFVRSATTR